MGGGKRSWFSLFGIKKRDHWGNEGEEEPRQLKKGSEQEGKPWHQRDGRDAKMEPRHPRRIRPSDDDRRHWVAEPDIDTKAEAFIRKEHLRMAPQQSFDSSKS